MKNLFYLSLLILVIFSSCKKNDDDPNPENTSIASQYMPLKIGNYFIYQYYRTDINGNETNESIDTVNIYNDTVINNQKFYKVKYSLNHNKGVNLFPDRLADSSGYLLFGTGLIFLPAKLNDTIKGENEFYFYKSTITNVDSLVTVPAGTFKTICCTTYGSPKTKVRPGTSFILYSKNIGIVKNETYFSHDPRERIGIKLIGYHLN